MAQYKVPQDVEAEDKLIGPFSFRQFIYLGVAALGIAVAAGLWQLFPGLIIIPLPFIVLFLVLALPLRKDQPMETYLTAVIRFYLKPRRRLWHPEGSIGLVTIVAPKMTETHLTKSVGGTAAAQQLDYLAQVVDTQGWATRGVISPTVSMNDTVYAEAQQAEDVLDENTNVARTFDSMIDQTSGKYKRSIAERFRRQAAKPADTPQEPKPQVGNHVPLMDSPLSDTAAVHQEGDSTHFDYNPYPSSMHQHVVRPLDDDALSMTKSPQKPQNHSIQHDHEEDSGKNESETSSKIEVSPDIMRLANNNDLSISALANEAHRLEDKSDEEVVINLR